MALGVGGADSYFIESWMGVGPFGWCGKYELTWKEETEAWMCENRIFRIGRKSALHGYRMMWEVREVEKRTVQQTGIIL